MNTWSKSFLPIFGFTKVYIPSLEFHWEEEGGGMEIEHETSWELRNKVSGLGLFISILFVGMEDFPANTSKTKYASKH